MPTNLLSLVLFIVLLAPGLVSITWRSFRPMRQPTVLGELAGLVFRSLICDISALAVFVVIRAVRPEWTPDGGALIRTPSAYLREHYALTAWWSVGLLVLACLFAYLGAQIWAKLPTDSKIIEKLIPGEVEAYQPGWWYLFKLFCPGTDRYVGCILDDDTYLYGKLYSFNPNPNEIEDRELILLGPITVRNPGEDTEYILGGSGEDEGVGAVSISARRIQYLSVSYLERPAANES
jgi:hypothetical protein